MQKRKELDPYTDSDTVKDVRETAAATRQVAIESNWGRVMETPEGRAVVWEILSAAGVFQEVFDTNALRMAFNSGRRNLGLMVLARVQSSGRNFRLMQEEAHGRRNDNADNS